MIQQDNFHQLMIENNIPHIKIMQITISIQLDVAHILGTLIFYCIKF